MTEKGYIFVNARVPACTTTFDLELKCQEMAAAAVAAELLIQASKLPEMRVMRSDSDDSPLLQYLITRSTARLGCAAHFLLDGDKLRVCYTSSPANWPSDKRALAFSEAYMPLLDLVVSKAGTHPVVLPAV
jgi:hypothetical protein